MLLKGKVYWARLTKPNDMSGKYELDLGHLSKKDIAKIEAEGVEVKTDTTDQDDPNYKGDFVKLKASSEDKDGNKRKPPKVVDAKKNKLPREVVASLGNGSVCIVQVNPYEWTYKKSTGVSLGLNTVQVLEYVEYSGDAELSEEEGYVYEGNGDDEPEQDLIDDDFDDDEIPF